MYSIFHIEGGIGKNILATAVIESLKKTDPDRSALWLTMKTSKLSKKCDPS